MQDYGKRYVLNFSSQRMRMPRKRLIVFMGVLLPSA
jgi:hypothetical protein